MPLELVDLVAAARRVTPCSNSGFHAQSIVGREPRKGDLRRVESLLHLCECGELLRAFLSSRKARRHGSGARPPLDRARAHWRAPSVLHSGAAAKASTAAEAAEATERGRAAKAATLGRRVGVRRGRRRDGGGSGDATARREWLTTGKALERTR